MTDSTPTVTVYWRPGCVYCMLLRRKLNSAKLDYQAIDIHQDEGAAATVRSLANGNETVPTVTIGDMFFVNPSARQVLAEVRAVAPHLLPSAS